MPSRRRRASYWGEKSAMLVEGSYLLHAIWGESLIETTPAEQGAELRLKVPELTYWKWWWLHTGIPWRYGDFHSRP